LVLENCISISRRKTRPLILTSYKSQNGLNQNNELIRKKTGNASGYWDGQRFFGQDAKKQKKAKTDE
jgi:hypothetical protein